MTTLLRIALLFSIWLASIETRAAAQPRSKGKLCDQRVGLITTDFRYKVPLLQMARIELRQCAPGDFETIQIAVWKAGEALPAMLIDTGDFGVVQVVSRANIFVLETGGATTNQVFVLAYKGGSPSLVLKKITRGTASITVTSLHLDVSIAGIFAGNNPPRTENYRFALSAKEIDRE